MCCGKDRVPERMAPTGATARRPPKFNIHTRVIPRFQPGRSRRCVWRSDRFWPLLAGNLRHKDDAVLDLDHDRLQSVTETWAAEAFAIGDAKLGTMGRADDATAVGGQKAARHPVERCADMRTGIDVDENSVALADGEQAGETARGRREARRTA